MSDLYNVICGWYLFIIPYHLICHHGLLHYFLAFVSLLPIPSLLYHFSMDTIMREYHLMPVCSDASCTHRIRRKCEKGQSARNILLQVPYQFDTTRSTICVPVGIFQFSKGRFDISLASTTPTQLFIVHIPRFYPAVFSWSYKPTLSTQCLDQGQNFDSLQVRHWCKQTVCW